MTIPVSSEMVYRLLATKSGIHIRGVILTRTSVDEWLLDQLLICNTIVHDKVHDRDTILFYFPTWKGSLYITS